MRALRVWLIVVACLRMLSVVLGYLGTSAFKGECLSDFSLLCLLYVSLLCIYCLSTPSRAPHRTRVHQ